MKAVVAAFNQEKALVGAFSVLMNLRMELFQAVLPRHLCLVLMCLYLSPEPEVRLRHGGGLAAEHVAEIISVLSPELKLMIFWAAGYHHELSYCNTAYFLLEHDCSKYTSG